MALPRVSSHQDIRAVNRRRLRVRNAIATQCILFALVSHQAFAIERLFNSTFLSYPAGAGGVLDVGDLNGDTLSDVIAGTPTSGNLAVVLNNGNETFAAPTSIPASGPADVLIIDINGDGILDNLTTNSQTNGFYVQIGTGDGTFLGPVASYTGSGPWGIAAGKLNGDNILDVAVTVPSSGAVSVFIGIGSGSFAPKVDYPAGTNPKDIAIGDLNGDAIGDVVTTRSAGRICVFINDGSGVLGTRSEISLGGAEKIAIADLNQDGHNDLAVTNSTSPGFVWVLKGVGNGTFLPKTSWPVGKFPKSLAVADLNKDGHLDIVVNLYFDDEFSILFGDGTASFGNRTNIPTGPYPAGIAVSDCDGDLWPDVIVGTISSFAVSKNYGAGFFGRLPIFATADEFHSSVCGDFDADGIPDVASCGGPSILQILKGNEDGTLVSIDQLATGSSPITVKSTDLNQDNNLDLVVSNDQSASVSVFMGLGDGTFEPRVDYFSGGSSNYVLIADFNQDARPDLAVTNFIDGTVSVLLGNGDGTFQPRTSYIVGVTARWIDVGDLNRDGSPDLAVSGTGLTPAVVTLFGTPGGAFTPGSTYEVSGDESVCLRDVNEDGYLDFLSAGSGRMCVFLGNGYGDFQELSTVLSGKSAHQISLCDIDGDLHLDAILSNTYGHYVSVHRGVGDGTFLPRVDYGTRSGCEHVALGDINQDGKIDLVTTNRDDKSLTVLLNISSVVTGVPENGNVPRPCLSVSPNPFSSSTQLSYQVPSHGRIALSIFDVGGRIVRTLVDEIGDVGSYICSWDGRDRVGRRVAPGTYFARFTLKTGSQTRKVILLER